MKAIDRVLPGYFQEVAAKSLEALMFVAGTSRRADVGLEVASSVRKRKWSLETREKLARAYSLGIRVYSQAVSQSAEAAPSPPLFTNLLNEGLERSIEAELGVALLKSQDAESQKKLWPSLPRRIRLQFNNSNR